MMSSLQAFCSQQFLGRHVTLACELVLEEITSALLLPLAKNHGIDDPNIIYELSADEGGDEAHLNVDFRKFVEAKVSNEEIDALADEVSMRIIENTIAEQTSDEPGVIHLVIK